MANEKINEYLDQTTVPHDDAFFGFDNWTGAAFLSTKILWSDLKTALGATGNLGTTDLLKTDLVRYYTFTVTESSDTDVLIFRNGSTAHSLIITGACEVYNNGRLNISSNLFYGSGIGYNASGNNNSVFGINSLSQLQLGDNNVGVGYNAGRYIQNGSTHLQDPNCSIFIGSGTKALAVSSINEIVIGCDTTGNGDNTVTIGNGNTLNNYLFGDLTIDGLSGAGGNIAADANGKLFVGPATDPIIHVATIASLPGIGSTASIYITDDNDYMYIWDADTSVYKKVGNEDIYHSNGSITDDSRIVKLKLDTAVAILDFQNDSGNSILKIDGLRDLFLENLAAPVGNSYLLSIDDAGKVTSGTVTDLNGIYGGSGSLSGSTTVTQSLNDLTFSTDANAGSLHINGTTGFVGIGTIVPTSTIQIGQSGDPATFKYVDGNEGLGKVITSDANGNATWSAPSFGGDGIFGGSGTIPTSTVATLIDTLTFTNGQIIIKGSGSTSATTNFLAKNSVGSDLLSVRDDGFVGVGTSTQLSTEVIRVNGSLVLGNHTLPNSGYSIAAEGYISIDDGRNIMGGSIFVGVDGIAQFFSSSTTGTNYGVTLKGSGSSPNQLHLSGKNDAVRGVGMGNIGYGQLLHDLDIRGFTRDAKINLRSSATTAAPSSNKATTALMLTSQYYDGASSVDKEALFSHRVTDSPSGASQLDFIIDGTTQMTLDESNTAGETRFLIYDVDNGTLERVSVGTADSGGVGFKVLRIPN